VGPLHPWVKDPPLPDWFHGTLEHHLNSSVGVDPSFYQGGSKTPKTNDLFELLTDPHAPAEFSRNLTEGWFFGALPDMNTENPVVAQYLLQRYLVDGIFRLGWVACGYFSVCWAPILE